MLAQYIISLIASVKMRILFLVTGFIVRWDGPEILNDEFCTAGTAYTTAALSLSSFFDRATFEIAWPVECLLVLS